MGRRFYFQTVRQSLGEVLADRDMASLGDAYVNFVCSLALSNMRRKPIGVRVKGSVLAEGLRKAGLRGFLGSGMSRHELADAAEALIVYAWLNGRLGLDECVAVVGGAGNVAEGVAELVVMAGKRVTFL